MVRLIASALWMLVLLMQPAHPAPVIGWVIGAIQAATVAQLVMVGLTAFSFFSSIAAKRKARKQAARARADYLASMTDRRITVLSEMSAHQVVYGSPAPFGGAVQAVLHSGDLDQYKHIVIAVAAHECEAIDDVLIDNVSVFPLRADGWSMSEAFQDTDDDGTADADDDGAKIPMQAPRVNVQIHLSRDGVDTADAFLMAACPDKWTADHKLSGCTYIVLTLDQRLSRFQGGLPNVTFKVRGKKVYDPRTGLTGYSRNAALCTSDFITSRAGYLARWDQFQIDTVIAAANACGDGEGIVYACDGTFKTDQERDTTLQQLEDCMAGTTLESGGVWLVHAGAWSTPVMHLGDEDMLAPIQVTQACHTGTERFNGARGSYIKATGDGNTTDFTPYSNAVFLAADGKQKHADMPLPFVGNLTQCTQLARIRVERSRGGLTLKISPKLRAWRLQPGDRITITSTLHGFVNKPFRVTDWTHSASAPLSLEVVEDEESFYDQVDAQVEDPAPNAELPSPFIAPAAPTMLPPESGPDWMVRQDDVLVPRVYVSWEPSMRVDVLRSGRVQVQWRQSGSTEAWQTAEVSGSDTSVLLLGLQTGATYDMRARFTTSIATGAWATTAHTVLGLVAEPGAVQGLALTLTETGVHAKWAAPSALDQLAWAYTELRRGATWQAGSVVFSGKATDALLAFFPVGNSVLWAAHVNTLGDESPPITAALNVQAPAQPVVTSQVQGKAVHLSWADCRTTQPLDRYRIYLGATLATATLLGYASGTTYDTQMAVAGQYRFWVVAYDRGGNASAAGYKDVVSLPSIDEGMAALQDGLDDLAQDLLKEVSDRTTAVSAEQTARAQALAAEIQNRVNALSAEAQQRVHGLTAEAQQRAADLAALAANLQSQIATLQAGVAEVLGAEEYVAAKAYAAGDLTHYNDKLYRAKQAATGKVPTNTAYWELVGDYKSIADAVIAQAASLQETRTTLTQLQGTVTSLSTAQTALANRVTTAEGAITGQGSAITSLTNRVTTAESSLASQSSSITSLTNRIGAAEGVNTAQASSISSLQTTVTQQGNTLTSQGSSIVSLANALNTLEGAGDNLLKASNVELVRAAGAYAIGGYATTETLAVGDTYTLVACVTHTPASGETASSVGVWVNGSQTIKTNLVRNGSKEIVTATFVRIASGAGTAISFYYYPSSVPTGAATVHWACLYKGAVVPPKAWQPSVAELATTVAGKAEASALSSLTTRVSNAEGTLTSQGSSITSLGNRLTTAEGTITSQGSSLASLTSTVTQQGNTLTSQGTSITNLQNALPGKADASALAALQSTVTQQGNTLTSQGSSVTALATNVGNTAEWRIRTFGSGSPATAGLVGSAVGLMRASASSQVFSGGRGLNLLRFNGDGSVASAVAYDTYGSEDAKTALTDVLNALTTTDYFVIFLRDHKGSNSASLIAAMERCGAYQFSTSAGNAPYILFGRGWLGKGGGVEVIASVDAGVRWLDYSFTLVNGIPKGLLDRAGIVAVQDAQAAALTSLTTRVTAAEGTITSQGTAITNLTNSLGTKADASALTSLTNRVSAAESSLTSQSSSITSITNRIGAAEGVNTAQASSISALQNTVTQQGNSITSQGSSITSLTNSLNSVQASGTDANQTTTAISLTGLDQATYYPVAIPLTQAFRCRFRVFRALASGNNPTWGTHPGGFDTNLQWETNASGWGARLVERVIESAASSFAAQSPVLGPDQEVTSSKEYVYLRGGAIYQIVHHRSLVPVLQPEGFTGANGTTIVAPIAYNAALVPVSTTGQAKATATALTALQSTVTQQGNTLTSQSGSITNLTSRITAAEGVNSGQASSISSLQTTVANQGNTLTSQASSISTLQSDVGTAKSDITSMASTLATTSGKVLASYTFKIEVDAGGRKIATGLTWQNNGSTSKLLFAVDEFAIGRVSSSGAMVYPFTVGQVGGASTVGVNGNLIIDGTVLARSIFVDNLGAITAKLGYLSSGQLDITSDGANGMGYVRSAGKAFGDGTDGFYLGRSAAGEVLVDFKAGAMRFAIQKSTGAYVIEGPGFSLTSSAGLVISKANVIDTLQLVGNAVTVPAGVQGNGNAAAAYSLWIYNFDAAGAPVIVVASAICRNASNTIVAGSVSVRRNGAVVFTSAIASTMQGIFTPPAGAADYEFYFSALGQRVHECGGLLLGCKR